MTQLPSFFTTLSSPISRYNAYTHKSITGRHRKCFTDTKQERRTIIFKSSRARKLQCNDNEQLYASDSVQAINLALEIARCGTGKDRVVFLMNPLTLPGFVSGAEEFISAEALFRAGISEYLPGEEHIPPPDPKNCLWNNSGNCLTCGLRCANYLEKYLINNTQIAAIVAEPLFDCPPGYVASVRKACDRHNVFLIFDASSLQKRKEPKEIVEYFFPDLLISKSFE